MQKNALAFLVVKKMYWYCLVVEKIALALLSGPKNCFGVA
jgi:hypothetical protein